MKVGTVIADISRMEQIIKALANSDKDNTGSTNIYAPCSIAANDARDAMLYLRKYINVLKDMDVAEEGD